MNRTRYAGAVLAAFTALLAGASLQAQQAQAQQSQLDSNPALFATMAALHAAGFDAGAASAANDPVREQVRQYLASRNIPSLAELKRFVAEHRAANADAELSQYVSFALSNEGPPDFHWRFKDNEMPPDVKPLYGFDQILARFYSEADLESLWNKLRPAYDQAIARYQMPVTQAVMEANAYLRNPTSGYLGRRFQIYVELVAPPGQIHTRSYKDDYFVVVTPSVESQVDEIRHGYLHYLLDPLSFKYAGQLFKKRGLIDYAQAAPALDEAYKTDLSLLMTESLIKAIEARLARGAAAKQKLVDQALAEGFVAAPALYELLPQYEKQDLAMRLYYPELFGAIDLRKEERRLANVQFVKERPRKEVAVPAPKPVELTAGQKALETAQSLYKERKLDQARAAYLRLVETTEDQQLHAAAFYGLARIAALQRDPEMAEQMFRKTLDSNPDKETRSWALIYLGRLADAQGDRDKATENYRAALEVAGLSPEARKAAEQGLKTGFTGK